MCKTLLYWNVIIHVKWPSIAPVRSPSSSFSSPPPPSLPPPCKAAKPQLQTGTFYNMPLQTHLLLLLLLLTDPKVSQLQLPLWLTGCTRSTRTLTQVLKPGTPAPRGGDPGTCCCRHAIATQTKGCTTQEFCPQFCGLFFIVAHSVLSSSLTSLLVSQPPCRLLFYRFTGIEYKAWWAPVHTILEYIGRAGRERAAELILKRILSEKANCRTQIRGCFWLSVPLLFWSGRRSSNSRGCPFSC